MDVTTHVELTIPLWGLMCALGAGAVMVLRMKHEVESLKSEIEELKDDVKDLKKYIMKTFTSEL